MEAQNEKKRVRDDSSELGLDSPDVKRFRDDLLELLDDSVPDSTSQELDSVMKSLEKEISAPSSPVPLVDLTSDSQSQIGYLLEASDDELGLPPGTSSNDETKNEQTELIRVSSDSSEIGGFWEFEDQIPSYDSFGLGTGENYNINTEYLAFDGLFDHSDVYFDSVDFSGSWRYDTLPTH
ncbi:Carbohydrate-responsive element-binding protein [Quillaja saponaria]|uniref:Carbohydrate-responsive element-binding protein n=1 Tax=Quillaja saponaria TaxID=32244 RepID=A0AAD7KNK2_QUISA|nr:Carbohydrate-responsive element-binding protein [Quillaja saponaria]